MTLLAALVETSGAVAATRSRSAKVAALAGLLRRVEPGERATAVAFLSGEPRQGKVGVGWATLRALPAGAASEPSLTIAEIDAALDALQVTTGPGSVGARQAIVADVMARATAAESVFLRSLLMGDLRQGALAGLVTDAVATAAGVPLTAVRRAAMLAGDLPRVAEVAVTAGEAGLAAIGLQPLRPVLPMLAATAATVAEAVTDCGLASVEWKLDGARIQAHRAGDEVRLFTRNLNDITSRLPALVALLRDLPVTSVVLDGEVLGTGDGDRPDAFQATMSRFSRHDGGGRARLGAWFFDCLHVDGRDLIDEPLRVRQAELDRIAGAFRIPSITTADAEEATAFAEGAVAAGHEGVMVKGADSVYEAGRRGQAWKKVKPVITLDLVVLAAEWGHGRRQGWLSNLHLGARDPHGTFGPAGGFVMVGKTFKGLTDALLTWQTEALQARAVASSGIVVTVRPELVVEIAIDGVQRSPRYPGGVALRFARVRRYRDDKAPADADTIDAVRALVVGSVEGDGPNSGHETGPQTGP